MKFTVYTWAITLLFLCNGNVIAQSVSETLPQSYASFKAYQLLNIPVLKTATPGRAITVAVVDDGFSLSHHGINKYIYKNANEIAGNGKDDDGNGYIDDISGWDAADSDNDVSIPQGKEKYFFHGTMTAGAVAMVAERCFGATASQYFKILPVKVLGDNSTKPFFDQGYEGIAYAVKQNADIIICAWSGGEFDKAKYQNVFDEAERKGILILGSVGNFYTEQADVPASISTVIAIAGVDTTLHKLPASNFGAKVDLSAPGHFVYTAYPEGDNMYTYADGSSAAVSLVGGCAAVLKILNPKAPSVLIVEALKNTAVKLDSSNRYYAGKLGAGFPNLSAAVNYLQNTQAQGSFFNPDRPEGTLVIDNSYTGNQWTIAPHGGFKGFNFSLKGKWGGDKSPIQFLLADSQVVAYTSDNFPVKVYVPGTSVRVQYNGKRKTASRIDYSGIPVDSTTLYCRDTRLLDKPVGEFGDGSETAEYANNCACKWQINTVAGKRIKIEFDEFDTQGKIDFVWIFDGTAPMQENILAKFSGPDIPPIIISRTNQVLVWFVTDGQVTAKGWHLKYEATDEPTGVRDVEKK